MDCQFLDFVTSNSTEVIKHLGDLSAETKESLDQRRDWRSKVSPSALAPLDNITIKNLRTELGSDKFQELKSIFRTSIKDTGVKNLIDSAPLDVPKAEPEEFKLEAGQVSTVRFSAPDFRQAELDSFEILFN
jgi:hypothetical protein